MKKKTLSQNKKLLPETKAMVEKIKQKFPLCFGKRDWNGGYARHCNSCIKNYKKSNEKENN